MAPAGLRFLTKGQFQLDMEIHKKQGQQQGSCSWEQTKVQEQGQGPVRGKDRASPSWGQQQGAREEVWGQQGQKEEPFGRRG